MHTGRCLDAEAHSNSVLSAPKLMEQVSVLAPSLSPKTFLGMLSGREKTLRRIYVSVRPKAK